MPGPSLFQLLRRELGTFAFVLVGLLTALVV